MISTWVLVTDGSEYQTRSTLAAVRALAAGGYHPAVTVSGPHSIAAASRFCERRVETPPASASGYREAVQAEMDTGRYLTVLPASDASLLALGFPVEHLIDKAAAGQRAAAVGLPVPPTEVFPSWEAMVGEADRLPYPAVVKPAISRFGAFRIEGPVDLRAAPSHDGPLLVQPFVTEPLRAMAGVLWRGELVAAVHQRYLRTWPPDCGTASAAETVRPDPELEGRLVALLAGYEGIFQAQLAGRFLLDLNLRVYGSLPLAVAAGANLPGVYCDLLRGDRITPFRARPGVFYRWIEGDLRHLASQVRSKRMSLRRALSELRPRRDAAHSTETLHDPGPMVRRLLYASRKRG